MRIGTGVERIGLVGAFVRQSPFFLRPWLHGVRTGRAVNMPLEQKVFFVQGKMAFIRFIGLEFFLRPFIEGSIDNSGYAARYFSPVRMHLSLTLSILPY